LTGTPVARFIVVEPSVQFKPIKGNALRAVTNFSEIGAYLGIESIPVHTEVLKGSLLSDGARGQFYAPFESNGWGVLACCIHF